MAISTPTEIITHFRQNHPDITFIRFQWQDYSGVVRARVLVIDAVIALVNDGKLTQASPTAFNCSVDNHVIITKTLRGVYWAVPDWSSLRPAANPRTAMVMCAIDHTIPTNPAPSGDLCPRQALGRVLQKARETWDLNFLIGFEVEFQVMKMNPATGQMMSCSHAPGHYAVAGLRDPTYKLVEQCVHQLRAQGVGIHGLHSEGNRGQYEIALAPLPPMQAVDTLLLVHDYLKEIFSSHGYMVTMSPKPVPSDPQAAGQHMHISLQPALPDHEAFFLAGILKRLQGLCAFCLPHPISYQRLELVQAGDAVCWGTESRIGPIRKIRSSYWEIRCIDATANMYLAMAAVISSGLLGMAGQEPLLWPDLGHPDNEHLWWVNRGDPMPKNLEDSLILLDEDAGNLASMIGRPLLDHYVEMKRAEIARIKAMDPRSITEMFIELF